MQTLNSSLLQAVLNIAEQAGEHLRRFYAQSVAIQIKSDKTPVTEADLFVSQFVTEQLQHLTPDIPILSEENCQIPLTKRQLWNEYWIVDPLDGTQQFLDRTDQFSVVIGLVQNGTPILGVIHAPILGKTYYAMRGHGAFLQKNNEMIPLAGRAFDSRKPFVIAMGSPNQAKVAQCVSPLYNFDLIQYGSSSLKAGLVAEGKVDCYLRFGDTGEWDTAVAEILLAEAGGKIFDLNFEPLSYNQRDTFINPHFAMVADRTPNWREIFNFTQK